MPLFVRHSLLVATRFVAGVLRACRGAPAHGQHLAAHGVVAVPASEGADHEVWPPLSLIEHMFTCSRPHQKGQIIRLGLP